MLFRSGTLFSTGPRPITIFHGNEAARVEMPKVSTLVLVVEVPRPFPYESQKAVPWDYNCNYTHQTAATDLTDVRGITQSRHCYAPDMVEKVVPEKLLVPASEEKLFKEKERPFREKKGNNKEVPKGTSKPVTEKKACKFLKFIKHSKYSVIE